MAGKLALCLFLIIGIDKMQQIGASVNVKPTERAWRDLGPRAAETKRNKPRLDLCVDTRPCVFGYADLLRRGHNSCVARRSTFVKLTEAGRSARLGLSPAARPLVCLYNATMGLFMLIPVFVLQ